MGTSLPLGPESSNPPGEVLGAAPAQFRDRSTGLVVFGILQIVIGCFAGLLVPFILLGALISRKSTGASLPLGNLLMSVATYATVALVLIVLGIGSIRARRWARDLTLVVGWLWLVIGTLTTIALTIFLPSSFVAGFKAATAAQVSQVSPGLVAVLLTLLIVFLSVFFIAVPIALVLFYRRKDVQETCRRRDSVERWTERCPLPVVAVSLVLTIGAAYCLLTALAVPLYPFFGRYLTGWPASAAYVLVAALDVFLAISMFRLKLLGWWVAVAALVLRCASLSLTIPRGDLLDAYRRLGWSQQQLQTLAASPALRMSLWAGVVLSVLFLGYLVWLKRYFVSAGSGLLNPGDSVG